MQDAGIMPWRSLKGASAFICWDVSFMTGKKRGLPEYHEACWCSLQRRTYLCFFLPLCLWLGVSFSLRLPFFHPLFITVFFSLLWRYAAPQEISSHRQSWQVNLRGNLNSNFPFRRLLFTSSRPRDLMCRVSCMCKVDTEQGWAMWERFCQKCRKDYEGQFRVYCSQIQVFMWKRKIACNRCLW